MATPNDSSDLPPGASPGATRVARRLVSSLDRFMQIEAASGLVLVGAACVALIWANSPWVSSYEAIWETPIRIEVGGHGLDVTARFLVNDLLMTVFFFVVGLEIRRELHSGELRDLRRAALPVVGAVGGMVVPALFYLVMNRGEAARGWGVPMATDIAFAVGVLALLGSRVPSSLRVFLLAVAIVDDLGAISVIAVFYSSELHVSGLGIALAGAAGIVALQRLGARHPLTYVGPAAVVWGGLHRAGIHPTMAGVIIGLMTPVSAWYGPERFLAAARTHLADLAGRLTADGEAAPGQLARPLRTLRRAQREVWAPVERLQHWLHPWVGFAIMPVFALANAGVRVADVSLTAMPTIAIGIAAGLLIGKPIGIIAASALAVRLRIAVLPAGLTWRGIVVAGVAAGIGFTMALFIAELAFGEPRGLQVAKLAVLAASATALVLAVVLGRSLLRRAPP